MAHFASQDSAPSCRFRLLKVDGQARRAELYTSHGTVQTPVFMPVGTVGSVKAVAPDDLLALDAEIILGNAYHLHLRPGDELIARRGGLHHFMAWPKPILTDSGGFQVFSLPGLRKISEEGVEFRSHLNGSKHIFTPEKVIQIQLNLGSDIIMPLDECVSYGADYAYTAKSTALTTRWAARARAALPSGRSPHMLFAITQGGFAADLRRASVEELGGLDFDGFAIGGLSVGEPRGLMHSLLEQTAPLLPWDKPRYLMGVGAPRDLLAGMGVGVDMFDCVLPTRNARNGTLYTSHGKINIKNQTYAEDDSPLDPACSCYTCRSFSKAYLRHLYVAGELLAFRLNSLHNLNYFMDFMRLARLAIEEGRFASFRKEMEDIYPE
ncbi:MAG: tRNA guanosine(34) transglycosylase Tgt [Deltaproteobacteria bacterium]|jgi:queuine tRNA-ribosyltransferase|nr:tRNA guanosine(34) transglycosylase Tgt [Deltaproteobacteria bacterium]